MPLVDPAAILARLLRARPELAADVRAAAHALADEAVDGLSTPPLRRRAPIRHPDPAPPPSTSSPSPAPRQLCGGAV